MINVGLNAAYFNNRRNYACLHSQVKAEKVVQY